MNVPPLNTAIVTPNIASEPANAVNPTANWLHDMLPNKLRAPPITINAAPIAPSDSAVLAMLAGFMSFAATPSIPNAPAIPVRPLSNVSQSFEAMVPIAALISIMEAAIIPTPNASFANPVTSPLTLPNRAIPAITAAIPANPFNIVLASMLPIDLIANANTNIAAEKANIPLAALTPNVSNLANLRNVANSTIVAAIANNPVPSVSGSILPSIFKANAIIIRAPPNIPKPIDVDLRLPSTLENTLVAAYRVPNAAAKPAKPTSISPISIVDIIFKAADNINIAEAIDSNDADTPNACLMPPILAIYP